MRILIKQSIYILLCSILIGILFNYFSSNGIPLIAKQHNNKSYDGNEVTVDFISIELAQKLFKDNIVLLMLGIMNMITKDTLLVQLNQCLFLT